MKSVVALAVAAASLAASAEIKVGIIGLDTSHSTTFTRIINVEKPAETEGVRIVAAYQWGSKDIVSSTNRYPKYIKAVKEMGVEIVPTIDELIDRSDVVFLETNDGREHLWQAERVFKSGKPVFIDKPLAHNLKDALAIYELGKKYNAKYFSSSSLRYGKAVQDARNGKYGKIRTVALTSPDPEEEQGTHNYYSWYGIHGFEPFVTVMGVGAEKVSTFRNEGGDVINVQYKDGRLAQLHLFRDAWIYTGYILPEKPADSKNPLVVSDGNPGYKPLLSDIVKFTRTGTPPFPPEETLEIFALMEAAEISAKKGGAPVTLAEAVDSVR